MKNTGAHWQAASEQGGRSAPPGEAHALLAIQRALMAVPSDTTATDASARQPFTFTERSEQEEGLTGNKEALHE